MVIVEPRRKPTGEGEGEGEEEKKKKRKNGGYGFVLSGNGERGLDGRVMSFLLILLLKKKKERKNTVNERGVLKKTNAGCVSERIC